MSLTDLLQDFGALVRDNNDVGNEVGFSVGAFTKAIPRTSIFPTLPFPPDHPNLMLQMIFSITNVKPKRVKSKDRTIDPFTPVHHL